MKGVTRSFVLSFAAAAAALVIMSSGAYAHQLPEGFSGFEPPEDCSGCHSGIFREWESSMHSQSSKFSDPLHSALHNGFVSAMEAKGKTGNYHCANCHTPTADNIGALMKGEAAPDPANPTNRRGVTCSFCHKVAAVVEGEKFHSYKVTDGIKGSSGDTEAPHGSSRWAFEEPYEMCLGCHGKKISGKGGVICSMEEEGITDCIPCHMAQAEGAPAPGSEKTTHAFHGMFGGHDAGMLKKGASVTLSTEGGKLLVTLTNPNPHYFPSTNPLRMAYVVVLVKDAEGKELFRNIKADPSDDPQAMLIKLFKAGDQAGVPSWEAEGVAKDTRLKPGEARVLTYDLPEGAASATAILSYRFAPPKALAKFGMSSESRYSEPQTVSSANLEL